MGNLGFTEIVILVPVVFLIVFVLRRIFKRGKQSVNPVDKVPAPKFPAVNKEAAIQSPPPLRNIFVSYRREDTADVTGRIYDRLIQHFGRSLVFKDVDSIPIGVDYRRHVDEKIGQCAVMLAVIGSHWIEARDAKGHRRLDDPQDFVRIEIESALRRGAVVVPVLVCGAAMPTVAELPDSLRDLTYRNAIAVRPDPDFHPDMNRLIAGISG